MNYEQFINKQIINYKGETGTVVSFDKEHIVVSQGDKQVTYKPDIAFKNKALVFKDDELNILVNKDLEEQDKASTVYQQRIDKINKEAIKRNKMASDKYIELEKKENALKRLFGDDFVYPPFTALKKKFPHAKRTKTKIELMFEDIKFTIAKSFASISKSKNVQS